MRRSSPGYYLKGASKVSQQTLLELLKDPKHQGVTPGILMALHTWSRQLTLYPHTHCLVTAGGLTPDGNWQSIDDFLLPVRVVKSFYRGKMQAFIRAAFECGELSLPPFHDRSGFLARL